MGEKRRDRANPSQTNKRDRHGSKTMAVTRGRGQGEDSYQIREWEYAGRVGVMDITTPRSNPLGSRGRGWSPAVIIRVYDRGSGVPPRREGPRERNRGEQRREAKGCPSMR